LVTGLVAGPIVVGLEVIDVDHEDRERPTLLDAAVPKSV
jgi:hypothetical protein